jgi:hypothetical protein
MRAQELRNGKHDAEQYQRGDDEEQNVTEIGKHGDVPVLCKTRQNAPDIARKALLNAQQNGADTQADHQYANEQHQRLAFDLAHEHGAERSGHHAADDQS